MPHPKGRCRIGRHADHAAASLVRWIEAPIRVQKARIRNASRTVDDGVGEGMSILDMARPVVDRRIRWRVKFVGEEAVCNTSDDSGQDQRPAMYKSSPHSSAIFPDN